MSENIKDESIKLGKYKHFKGGSYQVLGIAKNSEDKKDMVVYQQLDGERVIWVRPKEMFLEEARTEGGIIKRFTLIEEDKFTFEDKYKRALADYQNLLKQTAQEKQEFAKYANENIIREIIPVYNNLKMSLKHADGATDQWISGIKYVLKQFKDILESFGVKEIKTDNEKFNPETMEALEGSGEQVKEEVTPGYTLNGRVIVPARVVVE